MQNISINLQEWESKSPDTDSVLEGIFLNSDELVKELAASLLESGRLQVVELS